MTAVEYAAKLREQTVCTVDEAVPLFNGRLGKTTIYDSLRSGTFIVQPIRIGRRLWLPVRPLLEALGLAEEGGEEANGDVT